jgi:hypothetical protein
VNPKHRSETCATFIDEASGVEETERAMRKARLVEGIIVVAITAALIGLVVLGVHFLK